MQDRNSYHLHGQIRAARRQHYHQANTPKAPRLPVWLALLVIVACIGIAGRFSS